MVDGLSTQEALRRLRGMLRSFPIQFSHDGDSRWSMKKVFSFPCHELLLIFFYLFSVASLTPALLTLWISFKCFGDDFYLLFSMAVILSVTSFLLHRRRISVQREARRNITALCDDIDRMLVADLITFQKLFYPQFDIPPGLSSSFHWVVRDGHPTILPISLIVDGDVLLLRPGQVVLIHCVLMEPPENTSNLTPGTAYTPSLEDVSTSSVRNVSATPLTFPAKAVVTRAPFQDFVEQYHSFQSRKSRLHHSNLYSFTNTVLKVSVLLKLILLASYLAVSALFVLMINRHNFSIGVCALLATSFLRSLGRFTFILSSLGFTLTWLCALATVTTGWERLHQAIRSGPLWCYGSLDSIPSSRLSSVSLASVGYSSKRAVYQTHWISLEQFKIFWHNLFISPNPNLERMLITLGAVSSVCCVDQHGILSQPVPAPEKIFFFHRHRRHHRPNRHPHHQYRHPDNEPSQPVNCNADAPDLLRRDEHSTSGRHLGFQDHEVYSSMHSSSSIGAIKITSPCDQQNCLLDSISSDHDPMQDSPTSLLSPVVLNLRPDSYWPYLPHFEQPRWTRYISSLKPIGLSAMLNNCHSVVGRSRAAVTDRLRLCATSADVASSEGFSILPFCLCGLARQIGFRPTAMSDFTLHGCVGLYRLGAAFGYPCSLPKTRIPCEGPEVGDVLPDCHSANASSNTHTLNSCFATIHHVPSSTGSYQLMSQGSGNMLVSLCSDLWDGRDVCPMQNAERCALLDFYNRNASAAFCMGFSYVPLLTRPLLAPYTELHPNDVESQSICDTVLLRLPQEDDTSPTDNSPSVELHAPLSQGNCTRPASIQLPIDSATRSPEAISPPLLLKHPIASDSDDPSSVHLTLCGNAAKRLSFPCPGVPGRLTPHRWAVSFRSSGGFHHAKTQPPNDVPVEPRPKDASQTNGTSSEHTSDPTDLKPLFRGHIFLGLVSLQYPVNYSVVDSIRRLDQACVRFVYFSRENELRSRVFAERLGLECGWNCHISLATPASESHRDKSRKCVPSSEDDARLSSTEAHLGQQDSTRPARDFPCGDKYAHLNRSASFPMPHAPHVTAERVHNSRGISDLPSLNAHDTNTDRISQDSFAGIGSLSNNNMVGTESLYIHNPSVKVNGSDISRSSRSPSISAPANASCATAAPVAFSSSSSSDSSSSVTRSAQDSGLRLSDYVTDNKSRLPCGIENIRPHLDHVDNVPLQVSLFTDCVPESTREMIAILREYGEIVCAVANCYSIDSARLLAEGDVAIAARPILPQPCTIFTERSSNGLSRLSQCSVRQAPLSSRTFKPSGWRSFIPCIPNAKRWSSSDPDSVPLANFGADLGKQRPHFPVASALDFASRLLQLLCPWVMDMETEGFRVYEWIHEARNSVNNLFLVLTLDLMIPLAASVLQLMLQLVGLPAVSFILRGANDTVAVLWLPLEYARVRLVPVLDADLQQHSGAILASIPQELRFWSIAYMPGYGVGQLIWLVLFITPILSLSLLDRQVERARPLREPPRKRGTALDRKKVFSSVLVTVARFVPSLIVCLVCTLGHFLLAPGFDECAARPANQSLPSNVSTAVSHSIELLPACLVRLSVLLDTTQDVVFTQFIIYIVLISFTYANYGQALWKFRWTSNPTWCVVALFIIILQLVYLSVRCFRWDPLGQTRAYDTLSIEFVVLAMVWCPLVLALNELVASKERKLILSEHRLARLYFGTKLGMYSPV
ncbi:unnamed protein product [Dicrocoelium dendriticum]|nr:unnamed protein product [Dicrocoelium dendriticum]